MRIPDETLAAIRAQVSIVEVVGGHVSLRRSGKNWKGLCPFHAEKTPSFVVNEDRGTYHCFGCGAGGTVFTFLMEAEGRTFPEAAELLAERAGISLPRRDENPREREAREEKALLLEVLDLARRYYRHHLREGRAGTAAREYLAGREIPPEAEESFQLGCAPAGWDNLARYLRKKGVDLALAAKAGLVAPRRSGGYYDRLRDRLVFPIADASGRAVSFGGRVLGDGEPKYLNGPESPVFHKGEHLYGLHQGTEALRRERRALVVEGYLDVISLHARGFANALATLGTALTPEHVQALRRRVDEAVLVYDGDDAGRRAAFRSLEVFLGEGFPCRVVLLPPEHDPDSYVRGGGDLGRRIQEARPLFEAYLDDVAGRVDRGSVEGRLAAVDEVAPRLAAVGDPLARDLYCRRAAELLGVDEARLRERLRPVRGGGAQDERSGSGDEPRDPLARALVGCLVFEPERRGEFADRGGEAWIPPGPLREAARFVAGRGEPPAALPLEEAPASARRVLSELLVEETPRRVGYPDLEARLRLRDLDARAAAAVREIRECEARGEHERVAELLRRKAGLDAERAQVGRTAGPSNARGL